jgi:hypothetical protein
MVFFTLGKPMPADPGWTQRSVKPFSTTLTRRAPHGRDTVPSAEELRKAINLMTFEHGETQIWLAGKK